VLLRDLVSFNIFSLHLYKYGHRRRCRMNGVIITSMQ